MNGILRMYAGKVTENGLKFKDFSVNVVRKQITFGALTRMKRAI
ncbi:hypothetical protein HMPREF0663_10300 [Hoylesella oralis ATCC 33269]|uniref:Uncharacterized protein n=1 Tax=Hoylesella oralis ATCC 33269 TaxID=873533 RepID=E7RMF0_9BACT|nr:hypothetical protein HMPREF0663_10300 [Hoylesella oralis ATCC 33269]